MSQAKRPGFWSTLRLGARMMMRDARAGELRLLVLALVVAVAAVTSVGFLADRVGRALERDAGQMLGADRVVQQPRQGMGAEDFAYFVTPESGVRGVYFNVGGTPRDQVATAPSHQSPLFRITPEPAVTAGVEAMVTAAEALLQRR